jgi:hypothetical protein
MKWDRRDIDRAVFRHIIRRRDDGRGEPDGIPNVVRRVIADLDAVRTARVLDGDEMAAGERLHRGGRFFHALVPQHAQVRLAIGRRILAEDFGPIDVPVGEKRVRIARDGKEKSAAVRARELAEIFVIAGGGRSALELNNRLVGENERRAAFFRQGLGIFQGGFIGEINEIVSRHGSTIHKISPNCRAFL